MSGHSHAKTVAHKKGTADAQRSKVFSKMAGEIAIAARDGGDGAANPRLRMAIDRARSFNMPAANIERAVKRERAAIAVTAPGVSFTLRMAEERTTIFSMSFCS